MLLDLLKGQSLFGVEKTERMSEDEMNLSMKKKTGI